MYVYMYILLDLHVIILEAYITVLLSSHIIYFILYTWGQSLNAYKGLVGNTVSDSG